MTDIIDLASLDAATPCDEGAEIELLHPVSGAPIGIFITVLGKYSKVFLDHTRRASNEYLRKSQALKKRGKDEETPTVEKFEEKSIEMLVACTVGWRTGAKKAITFEGKDLEFSPANAALIYSSPKLTWIRAQVDEGIADLGNFMKA
jgi:hypothetical protein